MDPVTAVAPRRKDTLYLQVLAAVALGITVAWLSPSLGVQLKPLGDLFIKVVRMVIAPIIFCTVVVGLAGMGDLKRAGRVGLKALVYFEVMTTVALLIGLAVANGFTPGKGVHAKLSELDASQVSAYASAAHSLTFLDFVSHIIPSSFVGAFVDGDPLPVLFLAVLVGIALALMGSGADPVVGALQSILRVFFGVMGLVTRFAPLAALGAISFTVAKFGPRSLLSLGAFMACVYLTCLAFVFVALGLVARLAGFSLWKILRVIRDEIFIVLGTSSSESGLPGLMQRLEDSGCSREIVGIVVPAGYSFNLDGTCIYLTLASLFVSQALDIPLTLVDQLEIMGILLLTSKGAAAVTGGGFITLAATLAATGKLPVAGLALILGVDRFMSEARAITNLIGNAVAALVVARWERSFDPVKGRALLAGKDRP